MKRNAIARIIIFSIVIVILLGILAAGLGLGMLSFHLSDSSRDYNVIEGSEGNVNAAEIRNLQIEWVDGNINIETADTDTISFRESGYADDNNLMVWQQSGDTLTIRFSRETIIRGFVYIPSKDLDIIIPEDWVCEELEIETVSGSVTVDGIQADEISFDCVSAHSDFIDCTAREVSMTTVSGDLFFSGSLDSLYCEGVSAKCEAELLNTPREIDMEGISGNLILTLPADAGFTASIDSVSGSISTEFDTVSRGGQHICGDGSCFIEAETVSGNVIIKKAQ